MPTETPIGSSATTPRWQGVILAGGLSTRFGSDKALALHSGLTHLARAVNLFDQLSLPACIVTRPGRTYGHARAREIHDETPDLGPLGGLVTAFKTFPHHSLLVLPCDMPFLAAASLRSLLAAHEEKKASVTLFQSSCDLLHPFPGVYSGSLYSLASRLLCQGEQSLQFFLRAVENLETIPFRGDPNERSNINHAAEPKPSR